MDNQKSTEDPFELRPFKIVAVIGRFDPEDLEMAALAGMLLEKREEALVFLPQVLGPWWTETEADPGIAGETPETIERRDAIQRCKIWAASEIFVIDFGGIEGRTKEFLEYAQKLGKVIRFYSNDPMGAMCKKVIDFFVSRHGSAIHLRKGLISDDPASC